MTSGGRTIATQAAPPRAADTDRAIDAASLRARIGGYAVDMTILAAIAMVASIGSLFLLLFATDWGEQDLGTGTTIACLLVVLVGVPAIWSILNILLLVTRRQTGGQYVAALRVRADAGDGMPLRTALAWWFCGSPTLYSWPMAGIAGFPLLAIAALVPGDLELAAPLFVIAICIVLPIVALISAMTDASNRALHDRIAGVTVVPD
jgi:hypothetical protein